MKISELDHLEFLKQAIEQVSHIKEQVSLVKEDELDQLRNRIFYLRINLARLQGYLEGARATYGDCEDCL